MCVCIYGCISVPAVRATVLLTPAPLRAPQLLSSQPRPAVNAAIYLYIYIYIHISPCLLLA